MSPQTTQLVIRRFGPRSNRFSRRFERRCGMRQSTVEVFMSPIRAKFADLRKLGKPLWGAAFIKQEAIIHPHDLEKSLFLFVSGFGTAVRVSTQTSLHASRPIES